MSKTTITIELIGNETLEQAIKALQYGPPVMRTSPDPVNQEDLKPGRVWFANNTGDHAAVAESAVSAGLRDALREAEVIAKNISDATRNVPLSQASVDVQFTNPPGVVAMDGDRERGKAGPGHRRRTNEQIKSDEAYFASIVTDNGDKLHEAPLALGSEAPLISTGEERLDPRDAADEAAETAARKSDKPTREDLRAAVGRYTEKFGPKASIDNIRQIIGKPMIEVTEDEMAAAITRVETAIVADGAAPSELAPAEPTEAPQATKADVVEAIRAYGKKYDGESDDPKKMPFTQEDMPKIFAAAFGPGIVGLKTAPQTPEGLGKALAAVNTAVRDNPFKREVKG